MIHGRELRSVPYTKAVKRTANSEAKRASDITSEPMAIPEGEMDDTKPAAKPSRFFSVSILTSKKVQTGMRDNSNACASRIAVGLAPNSAMNAGYPIGLIKDTALAMRPLIKLTASSK